MTETRKVEELTQHPTSLDVYGANEETSDLEPSIKEHGVIVPLSITPEGVILSGNRRYRAAKNVGLEEVPCVVVSLATKEEEDVYIVEANRARVKTASQLYNEAAKLREAYAALAKKRQIAGLKSSLVSAINETATVEVNLTSTVAVPLPKGVSNPTRAAIAKTLNTGESSLKRLMHVGDLAKIGNKTAIEALALLDKGEITLNKAENMVRAALRKEQAENGEEPEREPTYMESCIIEARKNAAALKAILRKVLDTPDNDVNMVPWFVFCEELDRIETSKKGLLDKFMQKNRRVLEEINADPVKKAAFERGEIGKVDAP